MRRAIAALLGAALLTPAATVAAQPDDDEDEAAADEDTADEDGAAEDAEEEGGEDEEEEELERDAQGIPSGFRRYELIDVTTGMRDDTFWSIQMGLDGTVYVGTDEGRSYISKDEGVTWSESWVVPEVKSLFGFVGQRMYLGKIRSDAPHNAVFANLAPGVGGSTDTMTALSALAGDRFQPIGFDPIFARGGSAGGLSSDLPPAYTPTGTSVREPGANPGDVGPLGGEATGAAGALGFVLGAALSARAPRLSILLGVRGRPIANISLQRLLLGVAQRVTEVRKIIPDPKDSQHLFACTWYGLYQSYDGGTSWVRTFAGLTASERGIYDIVFDASQPGRVYMGTQRGLFVSNNNGDGWTKSTTVPEIIVKKIHIDPKDNKRIYIAGLGGVFRTSDRLQSVVLSYYSTLPRWNDVFWITQDPTEPETAYLGIVKTEKLSTSTSRDWQFLKPLRLENLVVQVVYACSRHRGHLYAMTRADLPAINYGSNGPESYLIESWDAGQNWRVLVPNRTAGDLRWFTVDPRDPDVPWVAYSRALVRVKRLPDDAEAPTGERQPNYQLVFPEDPTVGEVLDAALHYHKLDLGTYQANLDKLRTSNWIPTRLNVSYFYGRGEAGAVHDDFQFAEDRYRAVLPRSEWRVMAFATWRLPDIFYEPKTVAMQRIRELTMNDEIRNRVYTVVQRNYGELQRLRARQRAGGKRDLYTRAVEVTRMEQLEAMVDLMSGGYLTRREKAKQKKRKER